MSEPRIDAAMTEHFRNMALLGVDPDHASAHYDLVVAVLLAWREQHQASPLGELFSAEQYQQALEHFLRWRNTLREIDEQRRF